MVAYLGLLGMAGLASAMPLFVPRDSSLLEKTSARATYYYDLTNQMCSAPGDPSPPGWAVSSGINGGVPACERYATGANAKSMTGLGTNRIVAIDAALVAADPDKWCGKEVQITDANGKPFQFSEGPLFVWDGCDAARSAPIVDLSAKAFTELKGGSCTGGNPSGITFQVMDTNVWEPIKQDGTGGGPAGGGDGGSAGGNGNATAGGGGTATGSSALLPTSASSSDSAAGLLTASGLSSGGANLAAGIATSAALPEGPASAASSLSASFSAPTNSSSAAASFSTSSFANSVTSLISSAISAVSSSTNSATDSNALPTASASASTTGSSGSGGCTYGAWECEGLTLKVCNYQSTTSLGWTKVASCPSKCQASSTGPVECQ